MTLARHRTPTAAGAIARLVAPAEALAPAPVARLRFRVGDRALVAPGELVSVGQPVMEQAQDTTLLETSLRGEVDALVPGAEIDLAQLQSNKSGRAGIRPGERAVLLYVGVDRVARIALVRHSLVVTSPVDGVVEEVAASHISLRAAGIGLRGPVGWGQPVVGRVIVAVAAPDAELRAGAVDISAAGGILVAGARLNIEALTRARAIGVAGIICGGVVGRELQQLEESDERQRASIHAVTPFAILALDGYGRRPIPARAWDLLIAAASDDRLMAIVPDARLAIVGGDPATLSVTRWPRDAVRIAAGDGAGRIGRLAGLAGPVRRPGGIYLASGHVGLRATPESPAVRRVVALADLERLG